MWFFSVLNQVYQGQMSGYTIEKQSKTISTYQGQTSSNLTDAGKI